MLIYADNAVQFFLRLVLPLAHLTRCPQRIRALRLAAQAEMLHDNLQAKTVGFNVELSVMLDVCCALASWYPRKPFAGQNSLWKIIMYYLYSPNWILWRCTAEHCGCIIFIEAILDVRRCSKGIIMELQRWAIWIPMLQRLRPALRAFKMPVMRCATRWLCGASCARWGRHGRTGQGQQWKIDFLDGSPWQKMHVTHFDISYISWSMHTWSTSTFQCSYHGYSQVPKGITLFFWWQLYINDEHWSGGKTWELDQLFGSWDGATCPEMYGRLKVTPKDGSWIFFLFVLVDDNMHVPTVKWVDMKWLV